MSKPSIVPGSWLRQVGNRLAALRNMRVCLNCEPYNQLTIAGRSSTINVGLPGELCECGGRPDPDSDDCEDALPVIDSATCASKEGSGYLRGWSKPASYNSGDWNTRKATQIDVEWPGVVIARNWWGDSGCSSPVGNNPTERYVSDVDTFLYDVSTDSISQNATYVSYDTHVLSTCPSYLNPKTYTMSVAGVVHTSWSSRTSNEFDIETSWSVISSCISRTVTYQAPPGCSTNFPLIYWDRPDATSMTNRWVAFDTVAAALARGSPTTGSNCKTTAGTIGSTSAQSTSQLSISGTRSVTVTFELSGLVDGCDFEIEITIARYTAGGGSYVDDITDTVEFTATGTTETIEYEVPVNTDYDYEYDSATIDLAGAST